MMIKTATAVSLAMIASALGGQLFATTGDDAVQPAPAAQSFLTPRIDGRRLDVRFSMTRPADPAMTAERFCRSKGFDTVVGYSIQPSAHNTRLIGDLSDGSATAGVQQAFYAIRCAAPEPTTIIAAR